MATEPSKRVAEIRDDLERLLAKLRRNDEALNAVLAVKRSLVKRLARIHAQMDSLVQSQAESEESVIPLAEAGEQRVSSPAEPETPIPPPPTPEERQKEMRRRHPRLDNQLKLAVEALELSNENRSGQAVKLKEISKHLHTSANALYKKLHDSVDPAPDFRTCGSDTIFAMSQLIAALTQGRGESTVGASAVPDSAIEELKPFLQKLWKQIRDCAPGLYEEFHLQSYQNPEQQKPIGLPDAAFTVQKFYRVFSRKKDTTVLNDVIETVIPGYCMIKSDGQKALVSPAWVIISAG